MRIKRLIIFLPLLLAPHPAWALLCGSIKVTATPLAFGNYTPASTDYANTSITFSCSLLGLALLPDFVVALSAGNASSPASRDLTGPGAPLGYNVYTNSGYGTVWGDGSAGSVTQSYNALLVLGSVGFTGFGRIPAGQFVAAGGYHDVLVVTVSY